LENKKKTSELSETMAGIQKPSFGFWDAASESFINAKRILRWAAVERFAFHPQSKSQSAKEN
jgi:hypothetical protein